MIGALAAAVLALASRDPEGPYRIVLLPGARAPGAHGEARLVFAASPFGVAVTADGRHRYNVRISAANLPAPATLGPYHALVAWEVSPDLTEWHRLGTVSGDTATVGETSMNKFLLVITAEATAGSTTHTGPIVLHGTSPSGWLQTFLTHPLFRGISQ
ncbi:MAG TPA: hypothetical protein VGM20_06080 [Gemmatimonadales bacterium]|jgi:hypothetical protein